MPRYAISDIHGCAATFKVLLESIQFSKEDELFLLGDYVDRGPDSKGVIDYIRDLQFSGYQVHCLRGNHEQMMLEAILGHRENDFWITNGGRETLQSFDVERITDVPEAYIEWIGQLSHFYETPGYILVHAGLDTNVANPFNNKQAMMWSRNWYKEIDKEWLNGRIIVHGHTPTAKGEIEHHLANIQELPALVIDNGCFLKRLDFGNLMAFNLDNKTLHSFPCIDR